MSDNELREALAAASHEIWADWMVYLFSTCYQIDGAGLGIHTNYLFNWKRQILTPYANLTEREKDLDREQADKILKVLRNAGAIE